MKAMICERCGGKINPKTRRCEYCGTYYEREFPDFIIQMERPDVQVLSFDMAVGQEWDMMNLKKEDLMRFVHREMTLRLAVALEPNVEYKIFEDPCFDRSIVRGRVRVLPPGYRF